MKSAEMNGEVLNRSKQNLIELKATFKPRKSFSHMLRVQGLCPLSLCVSLWCNHHSSPPIVSQESSGRKLSVQDDLDQVGS